MQIEYKDQKTVFCFLDDNDLRLLNISLDTLTYGSNAFRKLIDTIVKQTDENYPGQFRHQELPLLVEATPLENNELFVQISTTDEADELDPRFAQFAPGIFEEVYADDEEEDIAAVPEPSYEPSEQPLQPHITSRRIKKAAPKDHKSVYVFSSYEDLTCSLAACRTLEELKQVNSVLYYEPASKRYFLTIKGRQNTHPYRVLMASFCEYSKLIPCTDAYQAWLNEHCKCLIRSKAIGELLKNIL